MPSIGDIAKGRDIGKRRLMDTFMWQACLDCGKERWVQIRVMTGKPRSQKCSHCANYRGGRNKNGEGYIRIRLYPDDFFYSMTNKDHFVGEHRLVMAKNLSRCLHSWEIVHHKNGIKYDNRIENLQLVSDDRHKQITILEQKIKRLEQRVTLLEAENIVLKFVEFYQSVSVFPIEGESYRRK